MGEDLLSLKWNNHKPAFCHLLKTLREKGRHTDVTLTCGSQFFPAHRLVLVACSQFFSEVLEHTGCGRPVIVLKDVCAGEMEALLDYMYLGEVDVPQTSLPGLIRAAESLKIKGLAVPDSEPNTTPAATTTTPTATTTTTATTTVVGSTATITTTTTATENDPTLLSHEAPHQDSQGHPSKRQKVMTPDLDLTPELQIQITEVKTEVVEVPELTFDSCGLDLVTSQGHIQHFMSEDEGQVFGVTPGHQGQAGGSRAHATERQDGLTNESTTLFPSSRVIGPELQEDGKSEAPLPPPPPPSPPPHRDQNGRLCYLCPFCHRSHPDKCKWRRHVRSHTGERPYQCSKCPYRSATRHAVIRHEKFRH